MQDKNESTGFQKFMGFFLKSKVRLTITLVLLISIIWAIIYFVSFDPSLFKRPKHSTTFYDRHHKPLRTYFSSDETYAQHSPLSEVSPHFLRAIVLVEDKHFYSHHGIVLSSLFRALWQNVNDQRIVSGGSTITMQTAKMIYNHRNRSIFNKISEIFVALKFEMHVSKSDILEAYINRLPFGNLIYGIKQASHFYFNKDPGDLSLNQAIYLALIPKSPSRYNPAKHKHLLNKRWKTILELFKNNNHITLDEYRRAQSEGIAFHMEQHSFLAPHFIEIVKERFKNTGLPEQVETTLDYEIQQDMENILREHLTRLQGYKVTSGAAIIMDNQTHEVIGFMGGPDYFDDQTAGQVNLAVALRQPGSTLKPFVYGLALESGFTASSILPDIHFPARGGFFPQNHDGRHHGPLRLRPALACSYNIPAFYLAMKLTPANVIEVLNDAGFTSLDAQPGFYGETIALGSGEVRLLDLTTAYSVFSNQGELFQPVFIRGEPLKKKRIFKESTAFIIWDILSDPSARFASFGYDSSMNLPFPVAIKTGTSKGFRDKWALGVNRDYSVGVWIGNPTGENMRDMSEVGSASTILRDIFLAIQTDWTSGAVKQPDNVVKVTVCALSGQRASGVCPNTLDEYFVKGREPQEECNWHRLKQGQLVVHYPELYRQWAMKNSPTESIGMDNREKKRIAFPQQGDFFYISDAISLDTQQLTFEVLGFLPGEMVEYVLDGKPYRKLSFPEKPLWPLNKGDHTLEIKQEGRVIDKIDFAVR